MPEMQSTQMTMTLSVPEDETVSEEELQEISTDMMGWLRDIEGIETVGAMSGGGGMMSSMSGGGEDSISMYVLLDEETKRTNNSSLFSLS